MARRFRFALEPVLRYREMIANRKKKDFAVANRAVDEEQMHRHALQAERAKTQDEVRRLYAEGEGFEQVVEAYRYINTVDLRLSHSAQKLAQLNAKRDEKRKALVEADRERRALEILRDRRREAHDHDEARAEQQELDTLAIQAKRQEPEGR